MLEGSQVLPMWWCVLLLHVLGDAARLATHDSSVPDAAAEGEIHAVGALELHLFDSLAIGGVVEVASNAG